MNVVKQNCAPCVPVDYEGPEILHSTHFDMKGAQHVHVN